MGRSPSHLTLSTTSHNPSPSPSPLPPLSSSCPTRPTTTTAASQHATAQHADGHRQAEKCKAPRPLVRQHAHRPRAPPLRRDCRRPGHRRRPVAPPRRFDPVGRLHADCAGYRCHSHGCNSHRCNSHRHRWQATGARRGADGAAARLELHGGGGGGGGLGWRVGHISQEHSVLMRDHNPEHGGGDGNDEPMKLHVVRVRVNTCDAFLPVPTRTGERKSRASH